jgi:hypothetical protein
MAHALPIFFYAMWTIPLVIGPLVAVAVAVTRLRSRRQWKAPGLDLSTLDHLPADLQDPAYADVGDSHRAKGPRPGHGQTRR